MSDASGTSAAGQRLKVALLGTGTMGAGMARQVAGAADLTVWNRTRERAEPLADVATVADDVPTAVAGAQVVVTMLYDTDSVAAVMEDARGHLADEAVWLQTSTVGVPGCQRLADLARDLGVPFVDAPVLGTKKPAEDGTLVVLASGEESLRERVDPVLDAVGQRTMWLPEVGQGSRLKLACNAWVATMVQGIAESLALAEHLGIEPSLFLDAVAGGALDAPYVGLKGRAMLEDDLEPSFALAGMVKDVDLMLEAAEQVGHHPRLLPALREHAGAAVDAGLGDLDMAAVYRLLH